MWDILFCESDFKFLLIVNCDFLTKFLDKFSSEMSNNYLQMFEILHSSLSMSYSENKFCTNRTSASYLRTTLIIYFKTFQIKFHQKLLATINCRCYEFCTRRIGMPYGEIYFSTNWTLTSF